MPITKNRSEQPLGAIFIDYEGTHALLRQHHDAPHELIFEVVANLRRDYDLSDDVEIVLVRAYADFSVIGQEGLDIQEALDIQGFEPRFVSRARQRNATEVQLCVDAIDMLHQRPDVGTFVFVTGNRLYLPLVSQLRRYGREVALVTLASAAEDVASTDPGFRAIDMRTLLPRSLRVSGEVNESTDNPLVRSVTHQTVTDDGATWALEIIEEHFGQYDEVYLTPLLRKLSEVMNDDRYDPKALINTLEEAGAVWLEKRRGHPHDYTVLLVDDSHPDVQSARQLATERKEQDGEVEPYDTYDDFADEPYARDGQEEDPYHAGNGAQDTASSSVPSDPSGGDPADADEHPNSPRS